MIEPYIAETLDATHVALSGAGLAVADIDEIQKLKNWGSGLRFEVKNWGSGLRFEVAVVHGVQIKDLTPGLHDPWPSEDGAEGWNSWSIV